MIDSGIDVATARPPDPGPPERRWKPRDPRAAIVAAALETYWRGERAQAALYWETGARWRVAGHGPMCGEDIGLDALFARRARLLRLTGGTYRQELVALEGDDPLIAAHVLVTARRRGLRLDQPSLLLFEVAATGIRRVTELPGDPAAWAAFWS